jgi:hypothetical protein
MRILLRDSTMLGSLATYLRRCDCTVAVVGPSAVEASPTPLQGVADAHLRMQLEAYVRVWMALHPGVTTIIDGGPRARRGQQTGSRSVEKVRGSR